MNYFRAIHTLHNSLKILVNIFKDLVIMLCERYKLIKPKQKSPKDELYSYIKTADRRIDKILKDYAKCQKDYTKRKNNAICKNNPIRRNNVIISNVKIGKPFDNEINNLVGQVKYEFDDLNHIFYSLDSVLNTSMSTLDHAMSTLDHAMSMLDHAMNADYNTAKRKLVIVNNKLDSIEDYCEYTRFANSHNIYG